MAFTNAEKQKRHKKMEALKAYGNEAIIQWTFSGNEFDSNKKSNEEIRDEINSIVSLPSGWTDEDYALAMKRINNIFNSSLENPNLLNNDLSLSNKNIFDIMGVNNTKWKASEAVRNIKSTLKLSDLNKADQIAVIAEVMRQLGAELLDEKTVPKTFSVATALSLIGHQYEKPEWTWNLLARNLYTQNGAEASTKIIQELQNPQIKKGAIVFNE